MIDFHTPPNNSAFPCFEMPEILYGTVCFSDITGTLLIEEWDKGVCFTMPEDKTFPTGTSVMFVIPPSGGFIEDCHDQVMDVEAVVVN